MVRTNESYVVALGANGLPIAYLLHKSLRRVNEVRDLAVRALTERTRAGGVLIDITHGPTRRMTYAALRKEIPGFDVLSACVNAGGMLLALRPETTGGDWAFDCELAPTRRYPGRLPHPADVYPVTHRAPRGARF